METKNHKKLPAQIRQLRDKAAGVRQDIIDKYRALTLSVPSAASFSSKKKLIFYFKKKKWAFLHLIEYSGIILRKILEEAEG